MIVKKTKKNRKNNKKKSRRKYLLEKCGLPDVDETRHCFADSTHQTCCHLDEEARNYADSTGNPIGNLSVKVFKKKYGRNPNKNELTPWCTCIGSQVCGYYSNKFNDKTNISFIHDPFSKRVIKNINGNSHCERKVRNIIGFDSHLTPGINTNLSPADKCSQNENDFEFEYYNY